MFQCSRAGAALLWPAAFMWMVCVGGCHLPRDPEGTLEHIRHGTLRVGLASSCPSAIGRPDPKAAGLEVTLLRQIAQSLDAEIEWVTGSESELLTSLESYELDVVIGRITEDSPWHDRVALSQPYDADMRGTTAEGSAHVFALPPGENGWLLYVDRWLHGHQAEVAEARRKTAS
jgi:polar amino acid transport system substrate-binding protein